MFMKFKMRAAGIFLALAVCVSLGNFSVSADKEYTFSEILIEKSGGAVISGVNEETPIPVGTAAKLMTVLLAAEQVDSGKLSLDDKLKTSAYANSMQGAQVWLMPNEEITVDELFKSVIIGNANDAAAVLAEKIGGTADNFAKLMNGKAAELGMENTSFTNFNGYYEDDKQISTAKDIAKLCAKLSEYDFLRGYFTCWRDFVRDGGAELVTTNTLVRSYKGIIGFKAGFTENSGYYAVCGAERDGVTYIAAVFGCEDEELALSEAKRLMNMGFSEYTVFVPPLPEKIPAEVPVKGGMSRTVPLKLGNVRSVVLPKGAADSVSSRIVLTDYLYAPVEIGDKAGEVQFLRGDKMMFAVDLTAAQPVDKMNVRKALVIIIKKLLTF